MPKCKNLKPESKDNMEEYPDDLLIEDIQERIKFSIRTRYLNTFERYPTKEEYIAEFALINEHIKCNVTKYDLGEFDEVERM